MLKKDLAIIIPAYKETYLQKSLLSLAQQTDQRFTVYIGDDNSPNDLKKICDQFRGKIDIVYHKFRENLGGNDLVEHWERCVKLMADESWIWIFSDDDIAEPKCVESFYNVLDQTQSYYDAYRFNTVVIDGNDNFLNAAAESPTVEDAVSLAYNIMLGKRGNCMPDHIFKRTAYELNGGIVNFIQAQASDWATSIKFASIKGLYTISGPRVKWRYSGYNISSIAYKKKAKLIFGHLQFIKWIVGKYGNDNILHENTSIKAEDIIKVSKYNLQNIITTHYHGIPYFSIFTVAKKISGIYNESLVTSLIFCSKINYYLFRKSLRASFR